MSKEASKGGPIGRYGAVLGLCMLAGAIGGGISGAASAFLDDGSLLAAAVTAVAVAGSMALGGWACVRWWRGLDEAAQEAHKWAWWWGSTLGLAIAGVVIITWTRVFSDTLTGNGEMMFMVGVGLVLACQLVGYAGAWAAWWLNRR